MSGPQSHLQTELDHALGESLLAGAMLQWRPTSYTLQSNLLEETLSHARGLSNVICGILEHRAVGMENGAVVQDVVDAWALFAVADLLSSLLEVITIVKRRETPESAEEPEPELTTESESLWLAGGDGSGAWVDARVKVPPTPADPDAVAVVLRNGLLHPAGECME